MTTTPSSKIPAWRLTAPSGLSLAAAQRRGQPVNAGPRMRRGADSPLMRILRPEVVARWRGTTVSYYTPQVIENTLRNALMGDLTSQWELFDLMEDTWPRLAKNLAEIKRAVAAMNWSVTPWAEDDDAPTPEAEERAKLVSHCLWRMKPDTAADERNFPGLIHDVLDAWGKGISVNEVIWETRTTRQHGELLAIKGTQWVHPQHYALGSDGRLGLRLEATNWPMYTSTNPVEVEPFPPYKFVLGVHKARTNHLAASAMLRPLAWWWAGVNFASDWLLNYAQLFGVPIRWANYASGTEDAVIAKIGAALGDMGSAGWATFPEGTTLQLHEGRATAGDSPQEGFLDRADTACDLLVLGQTLTSDAADRGTQALGTVHERIRGDVLTSAADWAAQVICEQLVPAILELNYGDAEEAPELSAEPHKVEDVKANAERDEILLRAGLELPKTWLYERHEVPVPQAGEETVGGQRTEDRGQKTEGRGPGAEMDQGAPDGGGGDDAAPEDSEGRSNVDSGRGKGAADAGGIGRCGCGAVLAGKAPGGGDAVDEIAARKAAALATAYQGHLAPLRQAILEAKSPEDALNRAVNLYRDWPAGRVANIVQEALELCAVAGSERQDG